MRPPELIDTHCHLNFASYDHDLDEVLRRASKAGITRIIAPAIDLASCRELIALAESHAGVSTAIGIHPNSAGGFKSDWLDELRDLAGHKRVIAIGEIGLDYYRDNCPRQTQRRALEAQLELAAELAMPVILHNRQAGADLLAMLEAWASSAPATLRDRLGVLHSFSASAQIAERAIELGFYIGFTGPITFKKADDLRAIAASIPRERLLIETDGPFLAPHPRRGKRNEPAWLPYINARLAELHGCHADEMARQTSANARRLFALP